MLQRAPVSSPLVQPTLAVRRAHPAWQPHKHHKDVKAWQIKEPHNLSCAHRSWGQKPSLKGGEGGQPRVGPPWCQLGPWGSGTPCAPTSWCCAGRGGRQAAVVPSPAQGELAPVARGRCTKLRCLWQPTSSGQSPPVPPLSFPLQAQSRGFGLPSGGGMLSNEQGHWSSTPNAWLCYTAPPKTPQVWGPPPPARWGRGDGWEGAAVPGGACPVSPSPAFCLHTAVCQEVA